MKKAGSALLVLSLSALAGLLPWQTGETGVFPCGGTVIVRAEEIPQIDDPEPETEPSAQDEKETSAQDEKETSAQDETESSEPKQTEPSVTPETEKTATDKNVPGKVKTLKAKIVSETSVKLAWTKVSRVTGYQVVMTNLKTGKKQKTTTTKRAITVKKLTPGVKYQFQVKAVRSGVLSKEFSPKVTVRTAVNKPGKVKNVRMSRYLNNTLNFKWDKVTDATSYEVYYKVKTESGYKLAGSTKKLYYSLSGLKPNTWYSIKVRAVRTVRGTSRNGKLSAAMTAQAEKIILPNIHGRRFNVTMKQTAQVTEYGTNKPITLAAGTRLLAWQGGGSIITCDLTSDPNQKTDYKVVRVPYKYLRYSWLATTADWYVYTKQQKELWLNQNFYSSSTNYLIWVNQYTCNTSVFQGRMGNWRMVHSCVCVVGKYGGTGVGTEKLLFRVPYLYGDVGVYFTWNATKGIGNAFHQRVDSYTRAAASHGCVRLGKSDLYYIYNNIPLGTTVVLT